MRVDEELAVLNRRACYIVMSSSLNHHNKGLPLTDHEHCNPDSCKHTPEELAALHSRTCWIPSVPTTYAYHTIQYFMTSIDAGMPMHVAFISPIVTNSARRSHDIIQSDVLLCRTIIQSSSDNTSMRVCLSLSFRECWCTPLLCCNACHSYACTCLLYTSPSPRD